MFYISLILYNLIVVWLNEDSFVIVVKWFRRDNYVWLNHKYFFTINSSSTTGKM